MGVKRKIWRIQIKCRKELYFAFQELKVIMSSEQKRNLTYEDVLIELMKLHPKGREILVKHGLIQLHRYW